MYTHMTNTLHIIYYYIALYMTIIAESQSVTLLCPSRSVGRPGTGLLPGSSDHAWAGHVGKSSVWRWNGERWIIYIYIYIYIHI